jgi:hypothetical protein
MSSQPVFVVCFETLARRVYTHHGVSPADLPGDVDQCRDHCERRYDFPHGGILSIVICIPARAGMACLANILAVAAACHQECLHFPRLAQ